MWAFAWDNHSNLIVGADGAPGVAIRIDDEWHTLGSAPSAVFGMTVDQDNNLYVGGQFSDAGGKESLYIAKAYLATDTSDYDGDNMPDYWETIHFGGFTSAVANALSSNGMNTILESYIADLNPTNPSSYLPSTSIDGQAGDVSMITIGPTSTNRLYDVRSTTNLTGNPQLWNLSPFEQIGIGSSVTFIMTNDAAFKTYRTGIKLP